MAASHGNKDVRKAIKYAESEGWIVEHTTSGHQWGFARCGNGCKFIINSTPKNPTNHAKSFRRAVDRFHPLKGDPRHARARFHSHPEPGLRAVS